MKKKGTWKRRVPALLLAALLLVTAAGCAKQPDPLEQIRASGVLRVAVRSDSGYYSFIGEDGSQQGFEVRLAEAIAADLGLTLRLVSLDSGEQLLSALGAKADLAIGRIAYSASLRRGYETSYSYLQGSLYAVTPRGVYFPTLQMYKDEAVGMSALVSENFRTQITDAGMSVQRYQSTANVADALLDQSITAYFCYEEQAYSFIENEQLQVQNVAELNTEEYVACAPLGSRGLMGAVNGTISRLLDSGELPAMREEWR